MESGNVKKAEKIVEDFVNQIFVFLRDESGSPAEAEALENLTAKENEVKMLVALGLAKAEGIRGIKKEGSANEDDD